MAGDWIKMRTDLRNHPKVRRIASALSADKLRAVGALHAVWSFFDEHSEDGVLRGFTPEELDEEVVLPGITRAMESVEWIEVAPDVLSLPRFEEHNGQSAKRRATESKRKKTGRKTSARRPQNVRRMSAECPQNVRTDADQRREEKNREEKREPLPTTPLLELPKDGVAALEYLATFLKILAPQMRQDDFTFSGWLRNINPDPYMLAAALCDSAASLQTARHASFATAILKRKFDEGFTCEDATGYVEFALQSVVRQRGVA